LHVIEAEKMRIKEKGFAAEPCSLAKPLQRYLIPFR